MSQGEIVGRIKKTVGMMKKTCCSTFSEIDLGFDFASYSSFPPVLASENSVTSFHCQAVLAACSADLSADDGTKYPVLSLLLFVGMAEKVLSQYEVWIHKYQCLGPLVVS